MLGKGRRGSRDLVDVQLPGVLCTVFEKALRRVLSFAYPWFAFPCVCVHFDLGMCFCSPRQALVVVISVYAIVFSFAGHLLLQKHCSVQR